ncbi:hypothetical protein [Moheibacter sediminis]|uniref:Calycin-like beta-barrel domain-containing protein n=1 Tax=Moheibacter sediminis TaxID=1434700 RepID=A0A1W2BR86_9FLAO|nr:hypothetical protein [Moheibacter sediminis]SMC75381.1 hypothetical protein SAMN06296427_10761 [Moheibacter sediminis]
MKKLIHLLTAFILLAMIACSSDDESSSSITGESILKMNIDGTHWEADSHIVIGQSETEGMYNFTFTGRNSSFNGAVSSISAIFSVSEDITSGTYELSGSGAGVTITGINGGTYMGGWITSTTFTIQITEVSGSGANKKFKGAFAGTLKGASSDDTIIVTNGEFSTF